MPATPPDGPPRRLVIIGAGPAGLSAGWESLRHGGSSVILERDGIVGGIARTVVHNGCRFDIGGHRFFTKVREVEDFWHEVLREEFLRVRRESHILYRQKFFSYPLKPLEAFLHLGPVESVLCFASFLKAHLLPRRPEEDFETWVSNRFGWRLYSIFFRTYTEKVWGVPCTQIRADWAAQRIRGLSLWKALLQAVWKDRTIKTLVDAFDYPRLGPGQLWEAVAATLGEKGSPVLFGREVRRVRWEEGRGVTAVETTGEAGEETHSGDAYLSSMPIVDLVSALDPAPPDEVRRAAGALRYRDFLLVALLLEGESFFTDNWIYVHSPELRVGRIQNFNNWSKAMVPRDGVTCLGLEYFCFESDELWTRKDDDLVAFAREELGKTGLVPPGTPVHDAAVVRMKKTYPMYDAGYRENVSVVREFVERSLPNLQLVGRNGMHRYNNQDHAVVTGMYAVRNLYGGRHDLWAVNVDDDYHEEIRELRPS